MLAPHFGRAQINRGSQGVPYSAVSTHWQRVL